MQFQHLPSPVVNSLLSPYVYRHNALPPLAVIPTAAVQCRRCSPCPRSYHRGQKDTIGDSNSKPHQAAQHWKYAAFVLSWEKKKCSIVSEPMDCRTFCPTAHVDILTSCPKADGNSNFYSALAAPSSYCCNRSKPVTMKEKELLTKRSAVSMMPFTTVLIF